METMICQYDIKRPDTGIMKKAGDILKAGGLVAFPTETVYGLGGNALDETAAARIYAAKGRPSDNPLIVHIADMDAFDVLAVDVPEAVYKLAEAFWPGPLTMIVNKSACVPYGTTGGLDTVAIRMPSHPVAAELIRSSGIYIAAPSANTSGRPSPTKASHVMDDLNGKVDMIIDGGKVGIGIESTIIDLSGGIPTILRPGYITKAMLASVIGEVATDKAILSENADKGFRPKAPGMKYKHYAPKGMLTIIEGNRENVAAWINEKIRSDEAAGKKTAVIVSDENRELYTAAHCLDIGSRENEETIAANLYDVLRKMDDIQAERIYSESFSGSGLGNAIMNRLLKAAGHHVIEV